MIFLIQYILCFWGIYYIFSGAGEVLKKFLKLKGSPFIWIQKIETILYGIGFVHFTSTILQLYFSHSVSSIVYLLFLIVLMFLGIYFSIIQSKTKIQFAKLSFVHFLLFLFLLLPFRNFSSEFMASEESGDHTIYLGPVKAQYIQNDSEITKSKWKLALTRAVYDSRIHLLFPPIEKIFPMFEAAKKAKWEIDPIDRVILEGFSPAWWALHWGLIGFGFLLPIHPETIYLSILFFLTSLLCLQVGSIGYLLFNEYTESKILVFFLILLLSLSACIAKITYGHFYLQLIGLVSLLWIFKATLSWEKTRDKKTFYSALVFSFLIGPSFYFMGTVYWGLIVLCFFLFYYKTNLLIGLFHYIRKPSILIGSFFYLPILLVNIGSFLRFLPSTSSSMQNKQYWDQVLGGTVTGSDAFLNPILGIVTYFQFYPKLPFKEQIDALNFILVPFAIGILFLLIGGIFKSIFFDLKKNVRKNLFLIFVLIGILTINLKSATHYYNYNKASQYTFPFLILSFPYFYLKLNANRKSFYLLSLILIFWILLLIPAKFRQIESFSSLHEKSMSNFLLLKERLDHLNKNTIFFFGESRNHALLETYMAGNQTIPVGIYPIDSFKKHFHFENLSLNKFMLKDKDSESYTLFDLSRFLIGADEYWVALSSSIRLDSTKIPNSLYLNSIGKVEVFAELKSLKKLIVYTFHSNTKPTVNRERFNSIENNYMQPENLQSIETVCAKNECKYTYHLEPLGKNFFLIENASRVEVF